MSDAGPDEAAPPVFDLAHFFMHKDGRYQWLSWVVQGTEVADSWYATARDITDQRALHDSLQEVEERLRLAMSMSESGSWDYDLADDHLTFDASAEAVIGIVPGTFGGRIGDLLAIVPAEDHDRVNQLRTAPAASEPIDTDCRILAADGSTRYVALRGKVVDTDRRGRPRRAVGIAWNVTSQKQMENRLLDLVMNDQLTGLKNRRSFDETLHREWRRANDSGRPLRGRGVHRFVDRVRARRRLGGSRAITISVGASSVQPTPHLSAADIVRAADRALYQAKANGKNQATLLNVA